MIFRQFNIDVIQNDFEQFPVIGILGPRQCGKTTLAKQLTFQHYFDLENISDFEQLSNPQQVLSNLTGVIVIDEIQRRPELFPYLRYLADNRPEQRYLILGSASDELVKKSSESLAGRIAYHYLEGFSVNETGAESISMLWLRGGMPRSYLASSDNTSMKWRENYITTYLERDIPQLGIGIPANTLRKFWIMLSHFHGQILNYSTLARSFGISDMTVRRYIDILVGTFMVQSLIPWHVNIGKRLVKSPKLYLRDSGIFHALQGITTHEQLSTNPKLGASWEGFTLNAAMRSIGKTPHDYFFWATHAGAEIDLIWFHNGKCWGIECKYNDAPHINRSLQSAMKDLNLAHVWMIYPGEESYSIQDNVTVMPAKKIDSTWKYE